MKKQNSLWFTLALIFPLFFNSLFFALGGFEHNASVWMSYGFIHFAYLMLLVTPKLSKGRASAAVLGFSLYSISSVYFLIEFVMGIVIIMNSPENYNATLLVQLIITGLYGIILVSNMVANEHTTGVEENRQYRIAYVKDASTKLMGLLERIKDKEAKKIVEGVYDAVYASPVKSHPYLAQMESHILQTLNELEYAVVTDKRESIIALSNAILSEVNERNKKLKTLN